MAEKRDIELIENNDTTVEVVVTRGGDAYDLTGTTIEFYAKQSAHDPDSEASMTYTTANGRAVIASAAEGKLNIAFDGADATPGTYVYHLDVIDSGNRHTVAYGALKVVNV